MGLCVGDMCKQMTQVILPFLSTTNYIPISTKLVFRIMRVNVNLTRKIDM